MNTWKQLEDTLILGNRHTKDFFCSEESKIEPKASKDRVAKHRAKQHGEIVRIKRKHMQVVVTQFADGYVSLALELNGKRLKIPFNRVQREQLEEAKNQLLLVDI